MRSTAERAEALQLMQAEVMPAGERYFNSWLDYKPEIKKSAMQAF